MERLKLAVPRRDLRIFGRRITKIIQNEIRRQNLIDTGNMLRSIETKVTNSRGQMKVNITGIDYLKYVDGNFDIIGKVKRGRAYKQVEEDFNIINNK